MKYICIYIKIVCRRTQVSRASTLPRLGADESPGKTLCHSFVSFYTGSTSETLNDV